MMRHSPRQLNPRTCEKGGKALQKEAMPGNRQLSLQEIHQEETLPI